MIKAKGYMVRIVMLVGALAISGCAFTDEVQLLDNVGLQTAMGNAGHDRDNDTPGNRGNGGSNNNNGDTATAGETGNQVGGEGGGGDNTGPGNSGFGRGSHANAGGGNGSETADGEEVSDDNPDIDPGQSGSSSGRSAEND